MAERIITDAEQAWRTAIAAQVRRNCTPSGEAYSRGGDFLVYAVADWIESPPAWSQFDAPNQPSEQGSEPETEGSE